MVGTANSTVAPLAPHCFDQVGGIEPRLDVRRAAGDKRGVHTPQAVLVEQRQAQCTSTSSALHPQATMAERIDTASCRWDSGTPLGRPVVPEVYASTAGVLRPRADHPARFTACPQRKVGDVDRQRRAGQVGQSPRRTGGQRKATMAPESDTRCPSSAVVVRRVGEHDDGARPERAQGNSAGTRGSTRQRAAPGRRIPAAGPASPPPGQRRHPVRRASWAGRRLSPQCGQERAPLRRRQARESWRRRAARPLRLARHRIRRRGGWSRREGPRPRARCARQPARLQSSALDGPLLATVTGVG